MYGRQLGAPEEFFGPPRPGQTWEGFQAQMHPAVIPAAAAAAVLLNPLAGAAVLLGGWMMGGSGPATKTKGGGY